MILMPFASKLACGQELVAPTTAPVAAPETASAKMKKMYATYRDAKSYMGVVEITDSEEGKVVRESVMFIAVKKPNLIFIKESYRWNKYSWTKELRKV